MTISPNIKAATFVVMVGLSIFACKKKEETPVATEPEPTAAPCFNSNYVGTYTGTGLCDNSGSITTYTTGTLSISKTGCETANVSLTAVNNKYEQLSQLKLNSSGGYDGKLSNGNNVTLILGTTLQLKATGSFTFNGPKQ